MYRSNLKKSQNVFNFENIFDPILTKILKKWQVWYNFWTFDKWWRNSANISRFFRQNLTNLATWTVKFSMNSTDCYQHLAKLTKRKTFSKTNTCAPTLEPSIRSGRTNSLVSRLKSRSSCSTRWMMSSGTNGIARRRSQYLPNCDQHCSLLTIRFRFRHSTSVFHCNITYLISLMNMNVELSGPESGQYLL